MQPASCGDRPNGKTHGHLGWWGKPHLTGAQLASEVQVLIETAEVGQDGRRDHSLGRGNASDAPLGRTRQVLQDTKEPDSGGGSAFLLDAPGPTMDRLDGGGGVTSIFGTGDDGHHKGEVAEHLIPG